VIASPGRLQPLLDDRAGSGFAAAPGAVPSRRLLIALALACVALLGLLHQTLGSSHVSAPTLLAARADTQGGLSRLPAGARAPISAALGKAQAAYRIGGSSAHNPAQDLSLAFSPHGVSVASGRARVALSVAGFGRAGAVRKLDAVAPSTSANRVDYVHGALREWYANGPAGLEQGFDLNSRPAGADRPLVFAISLGGDMSARASNGGVLLMGGGAHLRYGGLVATDASGRRLPASIAVHGKHLSLLVDDRGARYPVHVDPTLQQAVLSPSNPGSGKEAGYSVAVSGGTIAVGAAGDASSSAGAVYVFVKPASGWADATQTAELTITDPPSEGFLGTSVAIEGNTIVAGDCIPGELNSTGSVYVFEEPAGGWENATQTAKLTDGAEDDLGDSVALHGNTIVAGAPGAEAAQIFTKSGSNWANATSANATLTGTNSKGGLGNDLGVSVAISGNTIVAGAPGQNPSEVNPSPGAAYVFVEPKVGGWKTATQSSELTASDGGGSVGASVAIDGSTVLAGAPFDPADGHSQQGAAFVFVEPTSGGWPASATETAELTAEVGVAGESFGTAVGISERTIAVSALTRKTAGITGGAIDLYEEPASGWATTSTQAGQLTASDAVSQSAFGYTLSLSAGTLAVGAPQHTVGSSTRQGEAYVFSGPGGGGGSSGESGGGSPGGGSSGGGGSAGGSPAGTGMPASGSSSGASTLTTTTGVSQSVPHPLALATQLGLPSAKACVSSRKLTIHVAEHIVQTAGTVKIKSAQVLLAGHVVAKLKGASLIAHVSLVGLKKGSFKITVKATTTAGKTVTASSTFHTCVSAKRGHK
jgi:trimeric autotransporter adhesin